MIPTTLTMRRIAACSAAVAAIAIAVGLYAPRSTLADTVSGLPSSSLVPDDHPRIVNGVPTQNRPTTGGLLTAIDAGAVDLLSGVCSGTLIGCQHVITAAHCVCSGLTFATCGTPNPARYRFYLQHGGIFDVSAISVNPAFDRGVAGDVAVLTLSAAVVGIPPMPINTTGSPAAGTTGTIVGYGIDGFDSAYPQNVGILRNGLVSLTSCVAAGVPEPAHLCWIYDAPVGAPGADSNTCGGDSGGPLLVDLGGGDVVAGVTSGGNASGVPCQPTDNRFDSNVYENLTFIQGVAGADLANTSCGSITQVGDPGTAITTIHFDTLVAGAGACRDAVRKSYTKYAGARLKILQKCIDGVNKGTIVGPCPDGDAAEKIAKALAKVDPVKLATTCSPVVIRRILKANDCVGAIDASGLASCLVTAGNSAVSNLLDSEYADASPATAIPEALRDCQKAIAKVTGSYGRGRLKALTGCQKSVDKATSEVCPDAKASSKIAKLVSKVQPGIAAKCGDADVASLNAMSPFGGGCDAASSTATLASCEIAAHDVEIDTLVSLLGSVGGLHRMTFDVPSGTARLQVALNGLALNELDLFIQQGTPPTPTTFTASSTNLGSWESIDLATPAAGTWHAYVHQAEGPDTPFQLTMTTFGP